MVGLYRANLAEGIELGFLDADFRQPSIVRFFGVILGTDTDLPPQGFQPGNINIFKLALAQPGCSAAWNDDPWL
ncbi:hypothetical protein [Nioella aestuarii]|uniref:hypothetical protein n=1 Tax=Nioella aestuarii TaxID=1662864 RepID=UPI003D7F49E7